MNENFDKAIKFVLEREGGYINHPDDPGGETKYGISKKAHPAIDIQNLTQDAAKEIYKKDYWIKAGCDVLPPPMDMVVFDAAVQHGVGRAVDFQKKASGPVDYIFLRIAFYTQINNPAFLCGWMNRMVELYREIRIYL